jgi:hypothetical protein
LSDIPALRAFCFQEAKKMDFFDDGFDWEDWMIIGPLSEDMADEERRKQLIEKEIIEDTDDDNSEFIDR